MAAWPNGKALLSGGKDCGFESHRRRRVCFIRFAFCYFVVTSGREGRRSIHLGCSLWDGNMEVAGMKAWRLGWYQSLFLREEVTITFFTLKSSRHLSSFFSYLDHRNLDGLPFEELYNHGSGKYFTVHSHGPSQAETSKALHLRHPL
jgi:hypothetical protein